MMCHFNSAWYHPIYDDRCATCNAMQWRPLLLESLSGDKMVNGTHQLADNRLHTADPAPAC